MCSEESFSDTIINVEDSGLIIYGEIFMDTGDRLFEEQLKSHCCSETIMNLALEDMGWDEDARYHLVKSMGAFCGGLHEMLTCGSLCAAKAVLFLAEGDGSKTSQELGAELMEWFKDRYGSWTCRDLLENDPTRKPSICPGIIGDTYMKLHEMLEDIGAV